MAIKKTTSSSSTLELKSKKAAKKATVKKAAKKSSISASKVSSPQKTSTKSVKAKTVAIKSDSELLVDAVVEGILEKKGKNISVLNLQNISNRVCDYYIITQADSSTQVTAIADSVQEIVKKKTNEKPYHSEGFQNAEWILIDYVTVVVHVFQSHIREFYNLEALWADAEVTQIAFE